MKPVHFAALALLAAACTTERTTTVVNTITPVQTDACIAAAAQARDVPQALVTSVGATASPTGATVALNVNGEPATCKLDTVGNVEGVTFG